MVMDPANLDRLNLTQALLDSEIAISRSIDLTRRLDEVASELEAERAESARLRTEMSSARDRLLAVTASRTYRLASALSRLSAVVRRSR